MDILDSVSIEVVIVIILSEFLIQFINSTFYKGEQFKGKPFIVIFVSVVISYIEFYNEKSVLDIIKQGIFEYAAVAILVYEAVIKKVLNINLAENEKPTSL
jgi:hypothetical protein